MVSQAEVDADDLQVLHAAQNLLEVLQQAKRRQLSGTDHSPSKVRDPAGPTYWVQGALSLVDGNTIYAPHSGDESVLL